MDEINDKLLSTLESEEQIAYSTDYIDIEGLNGLDVDCIDSDTLHAAAASGVTPHVLKLRVGAVLTITRNLNTEQKLCNGTKVILVEIRPRYLVVRRPNEDELFVIPRILFKFPLHSRSPVTICRRAFPVRLAYACSIHKSQGCTIDKVGVDLRSFCFCHGQLYTAVSRVRRPDDIRVFVPPEFVVDGVPYTFNLVYRRLLLT